MKDNMFEFDYHGVPIVFSFPERSDYIKDKIISNANFYEEDLLAEISRLPIAEGAFCDVGANIGNHSVFFSRILGRDVYSFEPVLESYGLLSENLKLNGVASQVQAFNVAIGAMESCGVMQVHEGNLGASRLVEEEGGGVKISLLDSILPTQSNIALIKVDVEGYECEVLRGATETIKRCKPVLIIESQSIVSFIELGSILQGYGYVPIGQKGNTATVFFVHEEHMPLYRDMISFLSRNDVDEARRRVQGQLEGVKSKILSTIKIVGEKLEYGGSDLAADIQQLKGSSAGVQQLLEGVVATFNEHLRDEGRVREVESRCYKLQSELEAQVLLHEDVRRSSEQKMAVCEQAISSLEMKNQELASRLKLEQIKSEHLYSALERSFNSKLHKLQSNMFSVSNKATFGLISVRKSWDVFSGQLDRQIRAAQERQGPALTYAAARPSEIKQSRLDLVLTNFQKTTATNTPKVRVGIASIEIRRTALSHVIDCLYDQVDELYIYLNDYSFVPDFLSRGKITVIHDKGDVGDRGKFYGLTDFEGYYFTCDDDISYPPYYIKHCIDGIERYGRKSVVGWHGSLILHPFVDYYTPTSRRVLSFRAGRPKDTAVHVLGTGCTAFHTSTIQLKYEDFKTSNMADIYFALIGQAQNIPFVVLKHDAGEALPLDIPDDKAIHKESMASTGSKADTKALQNKLVAEHKNWSAPIADIVVARESKTVAYVGRVDAERWKKGGILKSGKMIISALRRFGHRVIPIELDTEYGSQVSSIKDADIVWIYPGDPNRPDFRLVEQLIEHAAGSGKTVFVNLSFNAMPARTEWIIERLSAWKLAYGSRVKACVFTNTLKGISFFSGLEENLVCIPKTIDFDVGCPSPTFSSTKGIFFGDLQKLLNKDLVGGDIAVWLDALRKELPGVPLYAVRQYGGTIDRDLGLEVIPYTVGQAWNDFISSCRIVTCLTPHATFEMIPVESAGLGIPAVYRPMLHAHSEVLSVSGIEVKSVEEFVHACKCLYTDEAIWNSYSTSSRLRGQSLHIDYISASIHQQMVMASS
ncbi:FkbM family methyltransferase [Pseudomonas sp. WS 5019]|nr:FkbM family methyltransferase [Pseudomonas sp. WS 5019]NMY13964.1 FkbM family methyltransferase [Pseudomonas sp. WS 5019]